MTPSPRTTLFRSALASPLLLWTALVIVLAGAPGGSFPAWRILLALFWIAAAISALHLLPLRRAALALAALVLPAALAFLLLSPQQDRDWEPYAARTPHATIDGDHVTVHDVRTFRWAEDGSWTPGWEDRSLDLAAIEGADFVLTSFGDAEALAHVMVSFRFQSDEPLVLSVEIRRERGESYHPVGGMFRQYELLYVAADERDAIGLRTFVHQDPTWVIPMNAGPEATRAFLLDMLERANALHASPEWYNTLTSSCATNLASHYERVNDIRLGLDRRIFLPGFSDQLLEELDLLPEGLTRDDVRERFLINDLARRHGNAPGFSHAIRASLRDDIPLPETPDNPH